MRIKPKKRNDYFKQSSQVELIMFNTWKKCSIHWLKDNCTKKRMVVFSRINGTVSVHAGMDVNTIPDVVYLLENDFWATLDIIL